jgi:hypothetical protein
MSRIIAHYTLGAVMRQAMQKVCVIVICTVLREVWPFARTAAPGFHRLADSAIDSF